ncbi:MAG: class I SAM-dependent rRNA methyltransferase [Pseudobdellovibrio sp.]
MPFGLINTQDFPVQRLDLSRDLTKHLKRGHRWIFANCIDEKNKIKSGLASIYYRNELLGVGICQHDTQLRFRLLCLAEEQIFRKNNIARTFEFWSEKQWNNAIRIRQSFNLDRTNSFRLINGEGDGFPGLIIDIYDQVAVIKHDHSIMEKVWNTRAIAEKVISNLPQVKTVYLKRRNDAEEKGQELIGQLPLETLFKENGLLFSSHIRDAAKTGFFLDQRDNREIIKHFSRNLNVLNLFSYTGGFSIYAAAGGARSVTSVDIAKVAIAAVKRNFEINQLETEHHDIAEDAFIFIDKAIASKSKFDLVITDPPSFAPNEKSVPQATAAYIKVFSQSIKLVSENGFFAASSCSSHISHEAFLDIVRESFAKAHKRATLIYMGSQPADHPYPLAMTELRYLKFALFRVDS